MRVGELPIVAAVVSSKRARHTLPSIGASKVYVKGVPPPEVLAGPEMSA